MLRRIPLARSSPGPRPSRPTSHGKKKASPSWADRGPQDQTSHHRSCEPWRTRTRRHSRRSEGGPRSTVNSCTPWRIPISVKASTVLASIAAWLACSTARKPTIKDWVKAARDRGHLSAAVPGRRAAGPGPLLTPPEDGSGALSCGRSGSAPRPHERRHLVGPASLPPSIHACPTKASSPRNVAGAAESSGGHEVVSAW